MSASPNTMVSTLYTTPARAAYVFYAYKAGSPSQPGHARPRRSQPASQRLFRPTLVLQALKMLCRMLLASPLTRSTRSLCRLRQSQHFRPNSHAQGLLLPQRTALCQSLTTNVDHMGRRKRAEDAPYHGRALYKFRGQADYDAIAGMFCGKAATARNIGGRWLPSREANCKIHHDRYQQASQRAPGTARETTLVAVIAKRARRP